MTSMRATIFTTKRDHNKIRSVLMQRGFVAKSVAGTRLEFTGAAPNVIAAFTELRHDFPTGYVSGEGTPDKRWIVLCCHDAGSPPEKARCFDEYGDALAWAGEYWKVRDLQFDPKRRDPFFVSPESGYVTDVHIARTAGKISYVSHADGDGPAITIVREGGNW